mgnify:CR=1 FL=1
MTTKIYEESEQIYGGNNLGAKDIFNQRLQYLYRYPVEFKPEVLKGGGLTSQFDTPSDLLSAVEKPEPINYWSTGYEKYGKIDEDNNAIIPNIKYFKQIKTKEETVFVFNFVADAFEDLIKFIKTQRINRLHPDDFLTQDISAKRGWFDIDQYHKKVTKQYYKSFVGTFLGNSNLRKKILNFDSFLDIFLNLYFPKMMLEFPLTKTGVVENNKVSPNMSGLCVEISLDSHSDDYNKFNKYLNNINYEFYTLAAAKFGFFVDKNAPWRLVANLNSPKMREYIQKYFYLVESNGFTGAVLNHSHDYSVDKDGNGTTGPSKQTGNLANFAKVPEHRHKINNGKLEIKAVYGSDAIDPHVHAVPKEYIKNFTTSDIYNKFYIRTHTQDVEMLKDNLMGFYNSYIGNHPFAAISELCLPKDAGIGDYYGPNSSRKTILKSYERTPLTEEDMVSRYNNLFWLKTYLIIRLKERTSGKGVADEKLNKVMSDINQLYYFVDKDAALGYINQYLKQFY